MKQSTSQTAGLENVPGAAPSVMMALGEWLLVLPAAILLAAGAMRHLQPRQYEPARTCWVIFNWAASHISHQGAAVLLLGLPGLALILGGISLVVAWRRNEALRQDAARALGIVRRHLVTLLFSAGTLLASAILAAVVMHLIRG
jgi:hypothetical protein